MKKIIILSVMFFSLSLLFGLKSLPSETVGFTTASCDSSVSDIYFISIPFIGDWANASDIDPTGMYFHEMSKWDPINQGWSSASYTSELGWSEDFAIKTGRSYTVSTLQTNFDFVTSGDYIIADQYSLTTPSDPNRDRGMNLIMHPLEKYNWQWAGSDLGSDINTCSQVAKFDPYKQLTRITHFDGISWQWDYETKIGDPLFVSVDSSSFWPDTGVPAMNLPAPFTDGRVFNIPKAFYWRVVRDNAKKNYDFNNKSEDMSFTAWISGREDDILTQDNVGCGFTQLEDSLSAVYINLGNFVEEWQEGDEVNIEVVDQSCKNKADWKSGKGMHKIQNAKKSDYRGFEPIIKYSGDPIVIGNPIDTETNIPFETKLYQNYPNPFNPVTTIKFSLKEESKVSLKVYNYSGQLVKTLANETRERGLHKIEFNASQFSSGVYYYTLKTDTKTLTKKMLMVK